MPGASLVITAALAYPGLLFVVAWWADRRAAVGRSVIGNAWVYALSLAVYCTAWTYFGSVGRAAAGGMWFLPIYLGPTLGMALAWLVLHKMIRIAKTYRITTIADFIASRYGKSPLLAGRVSLRLASPWFSAPSTSTAASATRTWSRPSHSSRWSSCWPSWRSGCSSASACTTARRRCLPARVNSPSCVA